jgi:hypothetical protein
VKASFRALKNRLEINVSRSESFLSAGERSDSIGAARGQWQTTGAAMAASRRASLLSLDLGGS